MHQSRSRIYRPAITYICSRMLQLERRGFCIQEECSLPINSALSFTAVTFREISSTVCELQTMHRPGLLLQNCVIQALLLFFNRWYVEQRRCTGRRPPRCINWLVDTTGTPMRFLKIPYIQKPPEGITESVVLKLLCTYSNIVQCKAMHQSRSRMVSTVQLTYICSKACSWRDVNFVHRNAVYQKSQLFPLQPSPFVRYQAQSVSCRRRTYQVYSYRTALFKYRC